jgi:hypothetical protein
MRGTCSLDDVDTDLPMLPLMLMLRYMMYECDIDNATLLDMYNTKPLVLATKMI